MLAVSGVRDSLLIQLDMHKWMYMQNSIVDTKASSSLQPGWVAFPGQAIDINSTRVRFWAERRGIAVGRRGRVPRSLIAEYIRAHERLEEDDRLLAVLEKRVGYLEAALRRIQLRESQSLNER